MLLPDGSTLMHGDAPYDPAKAHEYYLKTRHLHPRKKGSNFVIDKGHGQTVKLSGQQLAEQKAYADHRVSQITDKLKTLNDELRKKVAAAKKSAAEAKKPETAAEKSKAARDSKAYAAKHKTEIATKAKAAAAKAPSKPKADTVTTLTAKIIETRSLLKAAVAKQRQLSSAKKSG